MMIRTGFVRGLPRTWQLLYLVLLITLGLGLSAGPLARAHHPKTSGTHIYSIHSTSVLEYYCTDSQYNGTGSNYLSEAAIRARGYDSLQSNGTGDWDMGGRLDLVQSRAVPCEQLDNATRRLQRLEFHGWRTGSSGLMNACNGSGRTSCAVSYDLTDAGDCRSHPLPTHDNCQKGASGFHADYYILNLQSDWLGFNSSTSSTARLRWRHAFNHEVGHALGLRDPEDRLSNPYRSACRGNNSVMESKFYYNCLYDTAWPSARDRDEVLQIMNDTGHKGTFGAEDALSPAGGDPELPNLPGTGGGGAPPTTPNTEQR